MVPVILVAARRLRALVVAILEATGYPHVDADEMAHCLMLATLRGVDTHGVGRLPAYVRAVQSGKRVAAAEIRVIAESGASVLLDGGGGFAFVPALRAMRVAVNKARTYGIAAVAVRNAGHFGMATCYALDAVRGGMLPGDRIRLPGERAYREEVRRVVEGIPLSQTDARNLADLAREVGVSPMRELERCGVQKGRKR